VVSATGRIRRLANNVPLTLDLLNPKSVGFDIVTSTTTMSIFKPFDQGFSFYRANRHTPTHIHTYLDRGKVIAISAPP